MADTATSNNPLFTLIFGAFLLLVNALGQTQLPPYVSNLFGAGFIASLISVLGYYIKAGPGENYDPDMALHTFILGGVSTLVTTTGGSLTGVDLSAISPLGAATTAAIIIILQYALKNFTKTQLHIGA